MMSTELPTIKTKLYKAEFGKYLPVVVWVRDKCVFIEEAIIATDQCLSTIDFGIVCGS